MDRTVFEFLDYKAYLLSVIESRPKGGRGFRSSLAEVLSCQVTYITRILSGEAHLSLEQAEKANEFLGHSKDESDFFILLVLLNRAGTERLRERFRTQINEILQKRLNLKVRLNYQPGLSADAQAIYYSSWHYSAIHVLLGISNFQTKEALARRTGLPLTMIANTLEFLVGVGLAVKEGGLFKRGRAQIYLENQSPMISKHHVNWRIQAIRAIDRARPEDLHFSSVASMSYEDSLKVREIFVRAIEQIRPVIKDSKDEALFSYGLDLFEV